VAVHDVAVDDARAGLHDLFDMGRQSREVGGQDRRSYTSHSIEPPQWTHRVIEVLDIRTIVECSPQSGQTERSSYRCRQFTQRYRPGRVVGRSHGSWQFGHSIPRSTFSVMA
jgi:hypothetical protein